MKDKPAGSAKASDKKLRIVKQPIKELTTPPRAAKNVRAGRAIISLMSCG